jgi:hypothetical protein
MLSIGKDKLSKLRLHTSADWQEVFPASGSFGFLLVA